MTTLEPTAEATSTEAEDVVCLGCGALCDDIDVVARGGRIVEARHACPIGRAWFLVDRDDSRPDASIEGRACDRAEAVDHAAAILDRSRRPIVLGLRGASIESQSEAVALAEAIGAAIDPGGYAPLLRATQRLGRASATLGEIRNRADVVVFWGVDPATTHPRYLERYGADPVGRFLPGGRSDRTLIVVDRDRTPTADRADGFIPIDPGAQLEALWTLRAILKGVKLSGKAADPAWIDLVGRLKAARYAAIVFGPSIGGEAAVGALLAMVRDLNLTTRCVAMTLGGPGNSSGAAAVLAWRSGFASAVDFGSGRPRSSPGEADADLSLGRGEADAALIVADEPEDRLSGQAIEHLGRIPVLRIGPDATGSARSSAVAIASARFGIASGGATLRSDGVMLPVRAALVSGLPTEGEILRSIRDRIGGRRR